MDVRVGLRRKLSAEELMLLNCGWRRLLRVPWTARRSNQSILKEISPGCSLEGLILKLKLQYFGYLMWRVDSLEKTLMMGGIVGRRRRGRQRMRWLDGRGWAGWMASLTRWMWVWVNSGSWWWTGRPGVLRFMGSQRVRQDWATELNWSILKKATCGKTWFTRCSVQFSSVAQSCPTLRPHESQHTRPPCPSPTPGV